MQSYNGFSGEQRSRSTPWLNREYKAGRRVRPSECLACGQTEGYIATHWEDYTEPFGPHNIDYGLCHRCHMMLHMRFSAPRLFRVYASLVKHGMRFPVLERRHMQAFFTEVRDGKMPRPARVSSPREVCWFESVLRDTQWLKVRAMTLLEVKWLT